MAQIELPVPPPSIDFVDADEFSVPWIPAGIILEVQIFTLFSTQ